MFVFFVLSRVENVTNITLAISVSVLRLKWLRDNTNDVLPKRALY